MRSNHTMNSQPVKDAVPFWVPVMMLVLIIAGFLATLTGRTAAGGFILLAALLLPFLFLPQVTKWRQSRKPSKQQTHRPLRFVMPLLMVYSRKSVIFEVIFASIFLISFWVLSERTSQDVVLLVVCTLIFGVIPIGARWDQWRASSTHKTEEGWSPPQLSVVGTTRTLARDYKGIADHIRGHKQQAEKDSEERSANLSQRRQAMPVRIPPSVIAGMRVAGTPTRFAAGDREEEEKESSSLAESAEQQVSRSWWKELRVEVHFHPDTPQSIQSAIATSFENAMTGEMPPGVEIEIIHGQSIAIQGFASERFAKLIVDVTNNPDWRDYISTVYATSARRTDKVPSHRLPNPRKEEQSQKPPAGSPRGRREP